MPEGREFRMGPHDTASEDFTLSGPYGCLVWLFMTTPCAVQRCPNEATWPIKLKEPGEVSATFIATDVCKHHRDLLSSKSVEWVLEISKDPLNERWHQQTLIVGEDLRPLDEFIVENARIKPRPDVYSRIFSDNDHDGPHIDLELRRRGSQEIKSITVAIPRSRVAELIQLLGGATSEPG